MSPNQPAIDAEVEALFPCPFCGGGFEIAQEPQDNFPVNGMWYIFHTRLTSLSKTCQLTVEGHFHTKQAALDFWNNRVDLAAFTAIRSTARDAMIREAEDALTEKIVGWFVERYGFTPDSEPGIASVYYGNWIQFDFRPLAAAIRAMSVSEVRDGE